MAVQDLTRALELKVNLYEPFNPIISEAHYKLCLALEYAKLPSVEANKTLALHHLELAIVSVRERVKHLESTGHPTEAANAKEMIAELTIKADEMKNPAKEGVDVSMFGGEGEGFNEILQQKLRESLMGGANDLSGLVRRKPKETGEKRKIESEGGSPGKKVRVEDVEDEG
jgi:HAT1-interacting factor 1